MKKYQIVELQKELAKYKRIVASIKFDIDTHEGPKWALNNLVKEFNHHVRVAASIRRDLEGAC